MWVVFGLSGVLGLYLAYVAGWVVILIGLAAILSAIAYTGAHFRLDIMGWETCSFSSSSVLPLCRDIFRAGRLGQRGGLVDVIAHRLVDRGYSRGQQFAQYRRRPPRGG